MPVLCGFLLVATKIRYIHRFLPLPSINNERLLGNQSNQISRSRLLYTRKIATFCSPFSSTRQGQTSLPREKQHELPTRFQHRWFCDRSRQLRWLPTRELEVACCPLSGVQISCESVKKRTIPCAVHVHDRFSFLRLTIEKTHNTNQQTKTNRWRASVFFSHASLFTFMAIVFGWLSLVVCTETPRSNFNRRAAITRSRPTTVSPPTQ